MHGSSIKFLGIWINENLTWRDYIQTTENGVAKNIGLLYQRKHYFNENSLKQIYFAYIHTYQNYANITWASTHKIKLKKFQSKQKHARRIIFNKSKISPSEPLPADTDVFKTSSRRLKKVATSYYQTRRLIYDVLKRSDLRRLQDV